MPPVHVTASTASIPTVQAHQTNTGGANMGLQLWVHETQSLFLYSYLLKIALFSTQTTVNLMPHPVFVGDLLGNRVSATPLWPLPTWWVCQGCPLAVNCILSPIHLERGDKATHHHRQKGGTASTVCSLFPKPPASYHLGFSVNGKQWKVCTVFCCA